MRGDGLESTVIVCERTIRAEKVPQIVRVHFGHLSLTETLSRHMPHRKIGQSLWKRPVLLTQPRKSVDTDLVALVVGAERDLPPAVDLLQKDMGLSIEVAAPGLLFDIGVCPRTLHAKRGYI